jgi:hypothetical protein
MAWQTRIAENGGLWLFRLLLLFGGGRSPLLYWTLWVFVFIIGNNALWQCMSQLLGHCLFHLLLCFASFRFDPMVKHRQALPQKNAIGIRFSRFLSFFY